jgi:hypothetical protein
LEKDTQFLDDLKRIIAPLDLEKSGFYSSDSSKEFHIIDRPPASIIAYASPSLHVKNPTNSKVHLLVIDQGLDTFLAGYTGKRPEGILLNYKDLCFIELKLNVTSDIEFTQTNRIQDAIDKFAVLIPYLKVRFASMSKDFLALGFKYEAYIVLPSGKYPRYSATSANRIRSFYLTHHVNLFEANVKEFD